MKFTIDGFELSAEPEDTIMEASRRAGIFIPGLCYSSSTEPNHSCRLCMVEVEERNSLRLVAACAYKVKDNLKVITTTERVSKVRKTMLKLLYSRAPENPILMELMNLYGVEKESKIKEIDGQCILCGRCVKACEKLGISAISTVSRGITKEISTPYGKPAEYCMGCGSCSEVCPTKCITIEDDDEGRTIWNKLFEWARCEKCGVIVTTKEHFANSNPNNTPVICPVCKRRYMSDVFADTLGE